MVSDSFCLTLLSLFTTECAHACQREKHFSPHRNELWIFFPRDERKYYSLVNGSLNLEMLFDLRFLVDLLNLKTQEVTLEKPEEEFDQGKDSNSASSLSFFFFG